MTSKYLQKKKELEILIHAVRIYSQDIRMKFGIGKCAMLVLKTTPEEQNGTNQNKIRTLGEKEI